MMKSSVAARAVAWAIVPLVLLVGSPSASHAQPAAAAPTPPATPPDPFAGQLGDDLFGIRPAMAGCGLTLNGSVTQFYQGVTSGGLQDSFNYGGRVDLLLHIDGEKAGLWKGLFIDLHDETLFGQSANGFTGSVLPISMAQAYPITDGAVNALTGVKVTQALSENFALFAGKINTLDGFSQPFAGGYGRDSFWNTSFVFPTTLAKTIPYSALGGGFAVLMDLEPVVSFMVLDTNNTPTTSGFPTAFDSGVSLIASLNLPINLFGLPGHQGITGSWTNRESTDLDTLPYLLLSRLVPSLPPAPTKSDSWAAVYSFDQMLMHAGSDPKKGWGVFGSAGITDGNPNPIKWASTIGIGGTSLIPCRELDTFGVGYAYNGYSDSLKSLAPRLLPLRDEYVIESFYNFALTPWCHITPDFQYGLPIRSRVDAFTAYGIRAQINF